jgi:hypothetical protein
MEAQMIQTLLDPGLVLNGPDGMSCFPACIQMVMRSKNGIGVPSFNEMDAISRRSEGKYTWEYALLAYLARCGFQVRLFSLLDLQKLAANPRDYLVEFYGDEVGADQADNSDLAHLSEDVKAFQGEAGAEWKNAIPDDQTVRSEILAGRYVIPIINQRILQADAGYVAHSVVVYGVSNRGVTIHNPGPPATAANEIAWDLFRKAWEYPSPDTRMMISVGSPT